MSRSKRQKQNSIQRPAGPPLPASSDEGRRRRWAFRLLAIAVIPLLLLAGVEAVLRLAGFGYPAGFFRTLSVGGEKRVVENDKFSWRFFPRQLARRPLPVSFPAIKPAGTYRVFVLGESAAMGDPEPAFGFSRILEVLLRERYPEARFEVINVAFTAINSHVILPIARDCARWDGDLWVVYMGHNEVQGPFGPGTIFGAHRSRLGAIRAAIALKGARTGQLLEALHARASDGAGSPIAWHGLEMFLEHQVRSDDPRLASLYSHFRKNLNDLLKTARRGGAEVIVCTPASNLKDSPPFASLHSGDLAAQKKTEWDQAYREGASALEARQFQRALGSFQQAAALDPQFAALHFQLGSCLLALDQAPQARDRFERALDLDTLRFRTDSRLVEIIRETAASWSGRGVYFCDTRQQLAEGLPDGIPGEESFFDHVHLRFEGNYRLARTIADQVRERLPASMRAPDRGAWIGADRCAARLGLTGWHRYQMHEIMQRRLFEAPFTNQLNHMARQRQYLKQLQHLRSGLQPAPMQEAEQLCRQALSLAPNDPILHENLARVLAAKGDFREAAAAFQRVTTFWPHHPAAYSNAGLLLQRAGQTGEAERFFKLALERRSDFPEAHHGLAVIQDARGDLDAAVASYRRALQAHPGLLEARLNLGAALQRRGDLAAAESAFLQVLQARPNHASAHFDLAGVLLRQGKVFEAVPHLANAAGLQPEIVLNRARQAVEQNPEEAMEHFTLANVLAAQNRGDDALPHLEAAVRLDPGFWQARQLLGVELASKERFSEAQEQFAAVTRLRPDYVQGHLNLGLALAEQLRFAEAAAAFRDVLRLESTNQLAFQYLRQIEALAHLPPPGSQ